MINRTHIVRSQQQLDELIGALDGYGTKDNTDVGFGPVYTAITNLWLAIQYAHAKCPYPEVEVNNHSIILHWRIADAHVDCAHNTACWQNTKLVDNGVIQLLPQGLVDKLLVAARCP